MFEMMDIDDQGSLNEEEPEIQKSENSSEKEEIRRVDIMEQFAEFNEQEIKMILENTYELQLTEGCRGGCPFCARHVIGEKRNIKAHYSYESLKKFIEKYQSLLNKNIALYSKSDPLDWDGADIDNRRGIVDIYKLFEFPPQITTSIPPGSEQRFVDLCMYLAKKNIPVINEIPALDLGTTEINEAALHDDYNKFENGYIRISVGNHNKQRIEEVLDRLDLELADAGYSDEEIDLFYNYCIQREERSGDKLIQMGMLIENHNDIADPANFFCGGDGVVIAPGGVRSEISTAVTKYEPTGIKLLEIEKNNVDLAAVKKYRFKSVASVNLLDYPRSADGSYFELPDKKEDSILTIGRAVMSFRVFLKYMGNQDDESSKKLLKAGFENFEGMSKKLLQALSDCGSFAKEEQSDSEREKLEFYQLLGKLYYEELKFIFGQYAAGEAPESIQKTAALFRESINKKALTDCRVCFDLLMEGKFYM